MRFYDRENEINILKQNELQSENNATFTVLMGRRRVGKTSLLTHALSNSEYAYLFVSKDSESLLCRKFQSIISEQLGISIYGYITKFGELFEIVMRESQKRHFTIVFDEFQTLYKINPAIFSEIQDIWDRYHRESHINLIVSGSIQSLMKRIFEEKGEPLYGRPTSKFTLLPFSIEVLKEILKDHNPDYVNEDLLCLYMITGGVAKYVELLMDAKCTSKKKMLDYVCRPDSYFLTEGRDIMNQVKYSHKVKQQNLIIQLLRQNNFKRVFVFFLNQTTFSYTQQGYVFDWWFKNGVGKEYLGFKYLNLSDNKERGFYPDWIIKFKDNRIGIFDTKQGITVSAPDTKYKTEELQRRIKDQNTKSRFKYIGGIVRPKPESGWEYNNSDVYNPNNEADWKDMNEIF